MDGVYVVSVVVVLVGMLAVLKRVIAGPTLLDRLLGVNVIGTKTIVLLALIGFLADRPGFFLDIALAYALINFVATIAVLRHFEARFRGRASAVTEEEPS